MFDTDAERVGGDVAEIFDRASDALQHEIEDALTDLGRVAKTVVEGFGVAPTGGDMTFSNFYEGNGTLWVEPVVRGPVLVVVARGVWQLAESGAAPHVAKAWGRGEFQHPGTHKSQGVKAWTRGREAVFDRVGAELPERLSDAVEQAVN